MKKFKLGTKIIGMVSVLLILLVLSNGFGLIKINSIGEGLEAIAEEDIPLTRAVTEIAVNQLEQAVWLERALRFGEVLASEEAAQKGLKNAKSAFDEHAKRVNEFLRHGEEIAVHAAKTAKTDTARQEFQEVEHHLQQIKQEHADFDRHVHQIFTMIDEGNLHEAEQLAVKVEKEVEQLDHEIEGFLKNIEKFTQEAALKAEHDEQSAFTGMSVIALFSVVFGLFMGIFITDRKSTRLNSSHYS